MNELLLLRALLFAGECFLASLLLPLLGFAVTALLRKRAALRHLVWTTMFGVLAVLPLVALLLPARQVVQQAAAPMMAVQPIMAVPELAAAPLPPEGLLTPANLILFLVALWLAGLAFQALRLGLGGLGLMRLRRRSVPFPSEIATGCDVRLSHGEDGPSTFGILSPVVLLPRSAAAWPASRLEAVLRHEAAHVRRRDTLSQFIARLVCGLYWFNPLLWLAARSLRRDAEIAADDEVLAGGMTPSLYASELVGLAAESRGVTPGIAMAGPPLSERVQAVLAQNSSRKGVTRMDMAKTVSFGLAATLLLGVARFDLAVAQDAPAPRVNAQANPQVNLERNVDVNARPRIQTRDGRTVEVDVDVQRRIEVETDAVKAGADDAARRTRARAEAETDPAKRERYTREAAQTAASAAQVRADADRVAADVRRNVEVRRNIEARSRDILVEERMAQARAQTLRRMNTDRNGLTTDFGVHFEDGIQISAAAAEAMRQPEVRRAIDQAIQTAMADARRAINAAIAKATGQSMDPLPPGRSTFNYDIPAPDGAFPVPPVPPAPPAPPAPRVMPIPPVPPAPPPLN